MAQVGIVKTLEGGVFYAKDSSGNIRELSIGDSISENEVVYGDSSNQTSAKVEMELSGNDIIVLNQAQQQLIDSSLNQVTFGNEEVIFSKGDINTTFENADLSAWNNTTDDVSDDMETAAGDPTQQETQAGEEEPTEEGRVTARFSARDGSSTDVRSDLRDTIDFGTQLSEGDNDDEIAAELLNPQTPINPVDSDITATVVIGDAVSVTEANNTYLTYDVKLSNQVGSNVEVTLGTSGTATAGDDYKSQLQYSTDGGTTWKDVVDSKITLPADASVVKVRAEVLDDAITESDETVILSATTTDAQITDSSDTGTGTIVDDKGTDNPVDSDITATVVIGDAVSVTEANNTYLTYDVKLSNQVGSNVEVTLGTSGTATAGDDYKSQLQYSTDGGTTWKDVVDSKITLPADASVVKVRAEVLDDAITESDETVILSATTTDAQITDSSDTGTGTI
ncbi:hypothetical protein N5U23_00995, partial [Aliarcobacter butzleri]